MKHICIFIAGITLQANAADEFFVLKPGEQPNHLTPVDPIAGGYDQLVAKNLFLTNGLFGRFVSRPSFEAESCVSVHSEISKESEKKYGGLSAVPDDAQKYFITLTRASENLWYSMMEEKREKKRKEVKVTRVDREISLHLAIAIQRAWGRMLQHTKYPAKGSSGFDGITYQFSVWVRGLGEIHGETWTPQGGLPAEIASLGEALAEFAPKKDAKEEPLIARLKAFEAKIPKP